MYKILADIIHILHFLLIVPFFFTFFYKSGNWLIYNLILIPFIILDHHDDGKCSITSLEYKLRNSSNYSETGRLRYGFIKTLISKIFNKSISKIDGYIIRKYLYLSFMLVWLISFFRYLNYKKIIINFDVNNTNIIEEKIYLYIIYIFIFIYLIDLIYKP